jgi:hypothetical protein
MDEFDLASLESTAPSGASAPPPAGAPRGPLPPLMVAGVVLGGFGLLATFATATAVAGLGLWIALAVAVLPSLLLPAAIFFRLLMIGRKRRLAPPVRLGMAAGAALLLQVGLVIGAFELAGRTVGDVASVTQAAMEETVGEVPFFSRVLTKLSDSGDRTLPDPRHPHAGIPTTTAALPVAADAGPAATVADGGSAAPPPREPASTDGGVANVAATPMPPDAGVAVPAPVVGAAVLQTASLAKTEAGEHAVIVTTVDGEGRASHRLYPLAAFTDKGNPRTADVSLDGELAVLIGTAQVVRRAGDALVAVAALSRGQTFGAQNVHGDDIEVELRSIDDLRVLKGGTLLVTGTILFEDGGKPQLLAAVLAWLPSAPDVPVLIRRQGEGVPGAEKGQARRFELKGASPFGAFAVVEHFTENDIDVPTNTSGAVWRMNPQRLLVGHADAPDALAEVARTGVSAAGGADRTVQAFIDVAFAGDDRIVADVNYQQRGRDGALVVIGIDGAVSKVATKGSLFAKGAPRVRWLSVDPEGFLAYIDRSGALVRGSLDEPAGLASVLRQSKVSVAGAEAGEAAQQVRVSAPLRPRVARGGGPALVQVDVAKKKGLVVHTAASSTLVLQEGDTVVGPGGAAVIKSLELAGAHQHPLWPRR